MRSDYTHISVLLDRTGSMETIRDDTIGGFNSFLEQQKGLPGFSTMTLAQFDSQNPYEVIHDFRLIGEVVPLTRDTFVPRASTPLYDAMGKAIIDLDDRLRKMPEATRPAKVVVVIVTDGQENASSEFSKSQITKMIEAKKKELDWQFVFLSADLDAMADAISSGVKSNAARSFTKDRDGVSEVWKCLSVGIANFCCDQVKEVTLEGSEAEKEKKNSR
ncbi:MAG: VWA domain-containing protein [Candidatus Rifleibacteriota bacterium]